MLVRPSETHGGEQVGFEHDATGRLIGHRSEPCRQRDRNTSQAAPAGGAADGRFRPMTDCRAREGNGDDPPSAQPLFICRGEAANPPRIKR
jgi:hypothetical protein